MRSGRPSGGVVGPVGGVAGSGAVLNRQYSYASSSSSGSDDEIGGVGADRRGRGDVGAGSGGGFAAAAVAAASQASAAFGGGCGSGGRGRADLGGALLEHDGEDGGDEGVDVTSSDVSIGAGVCKAVVADVTAADGAGEGDSEGEGVFEIRDFTNASSFERITHNVSLAIKRWAAMLSEAQNHCTGKSTREEFEHLGFTYELLLQFEPDVGETPVTAAVTASVASPPLERLGIHTFPSKAHRLQRWFGVQHFATLSVRNTIIDVDSARTVLSALSLGTRSAGETLSSLPPLCCFVPIESTRRKRFVGELVGGGWRTTFATDQRNRVDPSLEHLAGLMEYFWQKLGANPEAPGQALNIGARFTYQVDTFDPVRIVTSADETQQSFVEEQQPPSASAALNADGSCSQKKMTSAGGVGVAEDEEENNDEDMVQLPVVHDTTDPVEMVALHCLWPSFPRGSFVDNAVYSELDPRAAPSWKIRIQLFDHSKAPLPLTARLRSLLEFRKEASSVRSAEHSVLPQRPKTVLASLSYAVQESLESILVPNPGQMAALVDECLSLPIALLAGVNKQKPHALSNLSRLRGGARGTRLARLAERSAEMKCFKGVLMLWCQVVAEMRQLWDAKELAPPGAPSPQTLRRPHSGVRSEHFDTNRCLVQQKFEMLQRSVEAKRLPSSGDDREHGLRSGKPCVRLELGSSGRLVVSPPVLAPALLTEDMALQLNVVAQNLSEPAERAELHGREVRSDMAAFKAANEKAELNDFLRWRSDGEEQLTVKPFPIEWLTRCWEQTTAQTAMEQPYLLFEPEREGEMALHYLENIEGTQLLLQLVRVLLHGILEELQEMAADVCTGTSGCAGFGTHIQMLLDRAMAAVLVTFSSGGRRKHVTDGDDDFAEVEGDSIEAVGIGASSDATTVAGLRLDGLGAAEADAAAALAGEVSEFPDEELLETAICAVESVETAVRVAISLRAKLPGPAGEALLDRLVSESEATVTSHAQRRLIEELFTRSRSLARRQQRGIRGKNKDIFDTLPYGKEFVLLLQPTPSSGASGPGTKRLYAEIRERHLRLATVRAVRLS
eukprot:TRINITY_DN40947_c0_g1_i1.p1 TRINITY_DN40947_c0_g1~~TRINITY_DN40947_c0_g1_i1.p1  ORF type:complete len:1069 (+),score=206.59 TRINITY_DN40947_c0_g1_i1:304-3510(+)